MRAFAVIAGAGLLAGCTSVFAEPRITLSPYYAVYQLRGDATVQTDPGGGAPLQNNPRQDLGLFGMDTHEDDVGFRAEVGDGFGGLRVDYYKLDMTTSQNGILPADWGMLQEDDVMRMRAEMDEVRISYVHPLFSTTTSWREEDLTIRVGGGAEFAWRDLTLRAFTDENFPAMRNQDVPIDGQTISAAARFRVEWMELTFDADYAISPYLAVRGDLGGVGQDLELRASYAIPLRDVTFFAGYRYSEFQADGTIGVVGYDADLVLDGWQFGLTVSL